MKKLTNILHQTWGIATSNRAPSPVVFSCIPSLHVPMVVVAPPKTGSVTATHTIKNSEYGKMLQSSNVGLEAVNIVPHLHWLSQNSYEEIIAGLPIDDSPMNYGEVVISRRDHMLKGALQAACIRQCLSFPGSCKTTIITTVRDPIAIYISSYFQNAALWNNQNLEVAESNLLDNMESFCYYYLDGWFDNELKAYAGFDVCASSFDKELGWSLFSLRNCNLGLIRTENLGCLPALLGMLWGVPASLLKVETSNVTAEKPDALRYAEVCNTLKVPRSILEKIYSSPAVRALWTEQQIGFMMKRWVAGDGV